MPKYDTLTVYTDGGSRRNPGPGAIAVVIYDDKGNLIKEYSEFIGNTTNNRAEYTALIRALELAVSFCKGEIILFSDSKLVVNQLSWKWKVRNNELKPVFERAKEREKMFEKVSYTHVRRENNKRADELVNECLDKKLKF